MIPYLSFSPLIILAIYFLLGIKIVRPTERAVIETLGKYSRFGKAGFNWIFPLFQRMIQVNITERMVDIDEFEAITEERLNTTIDLVVFFKVKSGEEEVKKSLYNVDDFESQIIRLAQTTARNVIGEMNFEKVNSNRNELNSKLKKSIQQEALTWGIDIVRVETKEIKPPQDVQDSMNEVLKAENEKKASVNRATAKEIEADGIKRANIKEAEGIGQGKKIVADANAYKIKVENESARKYFKSEAQKLKQFEVAQNSLQNNSKVILGGDTKSILKLFDINK